MSKYRNNLPQLSGELFITDGGLETTLVFHHGFDLPEFAAFDLLKLDGGYETLRDYYTPYIELAESRQVGFILESATWRASRDWGAKIGYGPDDLRRINRVAIAMLRDIRNERETTATKMVISGCIGPRGDGYTVAEKMTVAQAERYHWEQIRILGEAGVDMVSAYTINYSEEAVGITRAARAVGVPVVISFTVETDGRLPSGQPIGEAIMAVDRATENGPAYYMINCAHPTHFTDALKNGDQWVQRIRAVRANASAKSHAELDASEVLDDGDPVALGTQLARLRKHLPNINILGGCCGTDHRHIQEICNNVLTSAMAA